MVLEKDDKIEIIVDMSVKARVLYSGGGEVIHGGQVQVGSEQPKIPEESLALVDWERAYLNLLDYKARRGWHNLLVRPETLRQLMRQINYKLIADAPVVRPSTFAERSLLQEAVEAILRKYLDSFYRRRRDRWETDVMEYRPLEESDPNLAFNRERESGGKPAYIVKVPRSEKAIIEEIEKLLKDLDKLYREEGEALPRICFDRHLYLPLAVEDSEKLKTIPPALNKSEARFVRDLRAFWGEENGKSMAGKELFLLRNLTRGKGVGFFETRGFYPDFILWVLDTAAGHQRIVFVEPHGMLQAGPYKNDEKARLHERLTELAEAIARRSGHQNVMLDSFIISTTPYDKLRARYDDGTWDRQKFAERHILFFDERTKTYDYIRKILSD